MSPGAPRSPRQQQAADPAQLAAVLAQQRLRADRRAGQGQVDRDPGVQPRTRRGRDSGQEQPEHARGCTELEPGPRTTSAGSCRQRRDRTRQPTPQAGRAEGPRSRPTTQRDLSYDAGASAYLGAIVLTSSQCRRCQHDPQRDGQQPVGVERTHRPATGRATRTRRRARESSAGDKTRGHEDPDGQRVQRGSETAVATPTNGAMRSHGTFAPEILPRGQPAHRAATTGTRSQAADRPARHQPGRVSRNRPRSVAASARLRHAVAPSASPTRPSPCRSPAP